MKKVQVEFLRLVTFFFEDKWHGPECFYGTVECKIINHKHILSCYTQNFGNCRYRICGDYAWKWAKTPADITVKELGILTNTTRKEGDIIAYTL
jgi:hypothetical protein